MPENYKTSTALIQNKINNLRKSISSSSKLVILAATKDRTPEQINEASKAGVAVIGENRVQELVEKIPFLPQWLRVDFIGHLQTNKVKDAIKYCYLIHSVDNLRLAESIDKQAKIAGKIQNILLEINLSGEKTKYGFSKDEIIDFFPRVLALKNIQIMGLMTIAPPFKDKEDSRVIFRNLRQLRDLLEKKFTVSLPELSMGMSNDYQVALEEGATIIRLGRIIFE